MAKQVDASGNISLGKELAGKQFDVIIHPDGRHELIPLQSAADEIAHGHGIVQTPDGWVPPGGYDSCTAWALENRDAIEQHARDTEKHGTAAEQLQRYLDEHPEALSDDHGQV